MKVDQEEGRERRYEIYNWLHEGPHSVLDCHSASQQDTLFYLDEIVYSVSTFLMSGQGATMQFSLDPDATPSRAQTLAHFQEIAKALQAEDRDFETTLFDDNNTANIMLQIQHPDRTADNDTERLYAEVQAALQRHGIGAFVPAPHVETPEITPGFVASALSTTFPQR